ncbi:MAG: HD domain-containing protein [Clostridia bacterium]|nr:HD domain-containing protein [Clostridia bacterium]
MNKEYILKVTEEYIKNNFNQESTGHDWWHMKRVHDLALKINEIEKQDEFIVRMIALLHDIFDEKFSDGDIKENIKNLMKKLNIYNEISDEEMNNILHSIENLGFKGGFNKVEISNEGRIVQDADRIDAIGAIGIARCFAYNGKKGNLIYDPDVGIVEIKNHEEYRNKKRHAINHFYEKLLKIKDTINTNTGKNIANKRTEYMEKFLEEFYGEWNGKI